MNVLLDEVLCQKKLLWPVWKASFTISLLPVGQGLVTCLVTFSSLKTLFLGSHIVRNAAYPMYLHRISDVPASFVPVAEWDFSFSLIPPSLEKLSFRLNKAGLQL